MAKCPHHPNTKLVIFCPACRGEVCSDDKARASRANGKKGGRPKKQEKND